ncbi:DUF5681 domain-containing protein [Rhizorhapis sp.]|uniref:DUF5681 domain-containing protein n=1 Tax=Rhizorhapis sp. TaxID=1968842 RepID=UPI002B4711E3|nr:DUF5681 domain-containing protein [Rhizorhapis sp.]HKR15845.1 DUF5681 domain-containing protein [Rhizorhapis sp.]
MAKAPKGPKKQPRADYAVGYARPPQHSRVKPGQVLNPHGRNGKKASEPDAFDKARLRLSRVTIDGEVMMIPSDEAFYLLQMTKAMAGDKSAAKIVAQELAARRRLSVAPLSPAEIAQTEAEEAEKRALSARLVDMLQGIASAKRAGAPRLVYRDGRLVSLDEPTTPESPPDEAASDDSSRGD